MGRSPRERSTTMDDARVISISELLQLGRPLTGAASLSCHPTPPTRGSSAALSSPPLEGADRPCRHPRPLQRFHPLGFPAVLVGTLGLSSGDGSHASGCGNHCFSFSDGLARICCDILELDIAVIGKDIRVIAWNFLPLQRGGGFLEIIKCILANPELESGGGPSSSGLSRFPPLEDRPRARSCARGVLVSVSPLFSVPLSVQGGSPHTKATGGAQSLGFLAKINACKCGSCAEARSLEDLHCCLQGRNCHSFDQQVFIYFRGPSSSWRPVLSKLVGKAVITSSLKKKCVSSGGRESLVLASTERTVVYTDRKPVDRGLAKRRANLGKCQLGTYCGVVTGVFKRGMVVELDKKDVWLLITDPLLDLPHSFRVGAVIIVKNVHFLRPNLSWLGILFLGSCVRTTIEVKSFSTVDTRCHFINRDHSLLGHFIDSLPFYARFWVLLLILCFHKKFTGILSDKEILGSGKKEGLVQTYCKSCLPSIMFEHQLEVFEDFCWHDLCYCRKNLQFPPLKLVVPIFNFLIKCRTIWESVLLQSQVGSERRRGDNYISQLYCEGMYHQRMIRRIISSEELGLVLVGSLQVSPSSGRLQLVDSTGSVDVVIPDLSPSFDQHVVYEVKDYTLIIMGFPTQVDPLISDMSDPLSCRSILQNFQLKEEFHGVMIYVHFPTRNLGCLKTAFPLASRDDTMNGSGVFHLLLVTHKFLHVQNLPGQSSVLNKLSAFAEAICLPYKLILLGKYQDIQSPEVYEQLGSADHIPCFITFTDATYQGHLVPYNFSREDGDSLDFSIDKQGVKKVLLEFDFGCMNKYQQLHIGSYYILKPSKNVTSCDIEFLDSTKAFVTSQTCLWSFQFAWGKFLHACIVSGSAVEPDVSRIRLLGQSEKLFHSCADMVQENLDARVHLSHKTIEQPNNAKLLKNCFRKAYKILEQELSVSSCIQSMASMSLQPSRSVKHEGRLPEGNLVSLRGNVMDIHICHHTHNEGSARWSDKYSGNCTICIHVHEGHHMVKIRGTFGVSTYPLGMGPGANATFHRVLTISGSCGKYGLKMVPVSYVVVNYVDQLDMMHCYGNLLPSPKGLIPSSSWDAQNESLPFVSSGLISELIDYSRNSTIRIHCRVTGTFILSLEQQVGKLNNLQSTAKCKMPDIMIPLAGFILDDGSSSCCCWADCDRAEMLLQLNETASQSFNSSHRTSMLMRNDHSHVTVAYLLKKMIKKHCRITIRNYGPKIDSTMMDTAFSVDSKSFTSLEEDVLRFLVMNAQDGPRLSITGYMLKPNELPSSSDDFTEAVFTEWSVKHLWAEKVVHANPLMEGRNLIKELLPR